MAPLLLAMELAQFAPGLVKWITGSDKAADVAGKVVDVAQAITGTGTGEEALGRVRGLLGGIEAASRLPLAGGALASAGDLASRLQLASGAGSSVSLTGTWSRAEVDRAAARLADLLRGEFGWR